MDPWGISEFCTPALVEDGKPVDLEAMIFKPNGAGPFPLAVFNHGSTGNGTNPALLTETQFNVGLADFLNSRGWLVASPQRRGRGKSDGLYDEGFSRKIARKVTLAILPCRWRAPTGPCKISRRPWRCFDNARTLLHRVSLSAADPRGGILAVAYAGMHPDEIFGVINFVGGWMGTGCDTASRLDGTLFERGARFDRATLWLSRPSQLILRYPA